MWIVNDEWDLIFFKLQDGLVQSEDPSRRDFCGICLEEYFVRSREKRNEEQSKKVIKYLISLSQHSSAQYRQG